MVAAVKRKVYWSTIPVPSTPEILHYTRQKNVLSNFNNNINYILKTILTNLYPSLPISN